MNCFFDVLFVLGYLFSAKVCIFSHYRQTQKIFFVVNQNTVKHFSWLFFFINTGC
ncbi:hypothetical protein HMPREF9516_00657 [Enterococcus faecalis TX1302]|nr:hypothetical protein HMPREF9516_00657 [Enterococcus faecalis TX1302]